MAASGTTRGATVRPVSSSSSTSLDSIDLTAAAYDGHMMRLQDEYESDGDTLVSSIARPAAAYTSSPYVFERQPALPPPSINQELTPPPSPIQRAASPSKGPTAGSYFGAANGLLNRAGSVLGSRSKASSPTRPQTTRTRPPQRSPRLQFEEPTVRPGRSSPVSPAAAENSSKHKSKASWTDLLQVQGLSAPLNLGLVTSPTRETPPPLRAGSPHNSTSSESMAPSSSHAPSLTRSSTFASMLGWTPRRPKSPSPTRRPSVPIDENDPILTLNFDEELFRGMRDLCTETAQNILEDNSARLLSKIHDAYRGKCRQLADAQVSRLEALDNLTEEKTRAEHLKNQLDILAKELADKDTEISELNADIEERDRRARSIRLLNFGERSSLSELTDRERFFSQGLDSDAEPSEDEQSVFDGPDSRSRRGSNSTTPTEADSTYRQSRQSRPRGSLAWAEAAPFVKPESKILEENEYLKERLAALEETLDGCLGLVGTSG